MKKFDLLIIDDEEVIIDFFIKISEAENLFIDTALDGKHGLNKVINNRYKLIICDLVLPGLNGFEIIDEINKKNLVTPIIVTSGYSTIENAIKALQYGAIDFLPKPFTYDEVLCCLKRGMNYASILSQQVESAIDEKKSELLFVPCPPSYYRFGLATWIKIENDKSITTGLTDLTLRTISKLDELNLLNEDDIIQQGREYLSLNCDLGLKHKVLSPVSGIVTEVNNNVLKEPALVEKDPFFEGWIYKISPNNIDADLSYLTSCSTDRF